MVLLRRFFHFCLIVALVALRDPAGASTGTPTLQLTAWNLQSSAKLDEGGETISTRGYKPEGWHPVTVPTTVLAALVENGVYPDPYYGLNLKSIPGYKEGRWLAMPKDSPFYVPWWYRTEVALPPEFRGKFLTLHLDGINYQANIWLNGKPIAASDEVVGMFRRFEFDITGICDSEGTNVLAVEVIAPGKMEATGFRTKQLEATTGWDDHNPQPPDLNMGIWEDVFVRATGPVQLAHPYVSTDLELPSMEKARLTVSIEATNLSDTTVEAVLSGRIEDIGFSKTIRLSPSETKEVAFSPEESPQLVVQSPRVWWPNPVGPQELYELVLEARIEGSLSDSQEIHFGVREATTYINNEGWRGYRVNGKNILIRGGAWMTSDMLLRFTEKRYEALIRYAKEANLNMLRSEGFSIRETDEFFDLCDRYGVMVTQQLFGRSIPDEDLAIACVKDTILRIRNHPSLVHFLGHDETFPTENLDKAYRELIAKYTPERTYQPHSGAFEVEDRFETGGTRTGTRELWTYATPLQYYVGKEDGAWGFAQSGGIGGVVSPYESMRRMMPKEMLWPPWTEGWSFHTVIQGGDYFDALLKNLEARYGRPDGIEDFCMKAQVMNYESARAMFEAYGRNKYRATGITTWKYDAAWPASPTWQYIDWNLMATGAYYGAKKACEPLHIQYSYDNDSVYVINGYYRDFENLVATAEIFDFDMKKRYSKSEQINVSADGKTKTFVIERNGSLSKSNFLRLTLTDTAGKPIAENFYWLSTVPDIPGEQGHKEGVFFTAPKSIADHTDLQKLAPITLASEYTVEDRGTEKAVQVTMKNPGPRLAFFVRLSVHKGAEGDEVTPTYWQENCFSLLPGEEKTVTGVLASEDLEGAEPFVRVAGWNVVEAE